LEPLALAYHLTLDIHVGGRKGRVGELLLAGLYFISAVGAGGREEGDIRFSAA